MKTLVYGSYSRNYIKPAENVCPPFVIHPESSDLAEQLLVDSEALSKENYSGIFDENGDYVPQYCDNPDDIPRGALEANPGTAPGGAIDPEPGNKPSESVESSNESSSN